jgi:hypothetical protein
MNRSISISMLTLAALSLAGCSHPIIVEVEGGGKSFLHPRKGDVVKWQDSAGVAFNVNFPIGSPCTEPNNPTSICTLKQDGFFPYECTGCADPGLAVGSNDGQKTEAALHPSGAPRDAEAGYVFCDANTKAAKVYPSPLVITASTAAGDSKIQWFPLGGSGIATWAVTLQPGTCSEATINQTQPLCTLQPGAQSQTYQVTGDACTSPGTAVLTVH